MDSRSTIDSLSYTNFIGNGEGTKPLEEWLNLEDSINEVPKVRLAHPNISIDHEGTRKRKREIMDNFKWSVRDRVDAFFHDG